MDSTTIGERRLVSGRIRAVYRYFAPFVVALVLFTLAGIFVEADFPDIDWGIAIVSLPLSIFSVPAAGLYYSLRFKLHFVALLCTSVAAIFLPPVAWTGYQILHVMAWERGWLPLTFEYILKFSFWPAIAATILYQILITYYFRRKAISLLERRAF